MCMYHCTHKVAQYRWLTSGRPVQARNEAEQLTYQAEKSLSDFGDKVTDEIKQEINTAITNVKTAKDGEDLDDLKGKIDELSKAVQKIGQHMASQSGGSGGGDAGSGSAGGSAGATGSGESQENRSTGG